MNKARGSWRYQGDRLSDLLRGLLSFFSTLLGSSPIIAVFPALSVLRPLSFLHIHCDLGFLNLCLLVILEDGEVFHKLGEVIM